MVYFCDKIFHYFVDCWKWLKLYLPYDPFFLAISCALLMDLFINYPAMSKTLWSLGYIHMYFNLIVQWSYVPQRMTCDIVLTYGDCWIEDADSLGYFWDFLLCNAMACGITTAAVLADKFIHNGFRYWGGIEYNEVDWWNGVNI